MLFDVVQREHRGKHTSRGFSFKSLLNKTQDGTKYWWTIITKRITKHSKAPHTVQDIYTLTTHTNKSGVHFNATLLLFYHQFHFQFGKKKKNISLCLNVLLHRL